MSSRLVTVFGGSGFLGRHLVQRLAADGAIVRVAVRDVEAAQFLKPMGEIGQIVPVAANITDESQVAAAVEGAQRVVNLVGILSQWGRSTFQRVHGEGAANVARAARDAGAERLVQVSAIGADKDSASQYASTKAEGEEAVKDAFNGASIVRPSVVFGPEDNFFNMFAGMTLLSPVLPVFGCPTVPKVTLFGDPMVHIDFYGDGGTKLQPVYVGDVAEAIMNILGDPSTAGKTYELGGPTVYSFKEIMELLLSQIGRRRLLAPMPFAVARFEAWFIEKFPNPLLTRDQLTLLEKDNVVGRKALSFKALGMKATPAEVVLPTYLHRFRPQTMQSVRPLA